jgi:phosphatidylglycerol:prolipoprotein diacylglycerol transferase
LDAGGGKTMTLSAECYGLGYLTGLAVFAWMAWRRKLATAGIMAVMGAGLIGGLVGANLAQWVFGGVAGKTVLGGIAGGYLCVILYKRHLGLRRSTGDLFAVAISAGEAVGRWGCFFGGCCYGKACSLPWAVRQHGELRHPTQLYLSAANALILVALWRFDKLRPPENGLFYLQGTLYCVARFVIEFFRAGPPPVWGLTLAQWACLAGFAFFSIQLTRLMRSSSSSLNINAVPAR